MSSTSSSLAETRPLVWFVTGTPPGFGRELVPAALQRGDSVVATSRTPDKVLSVFPAAHKLPVVQMDLRDQEQIASVAEVAAARFGRIKIDAIRGEFEAWRKDYLAARRRPGRDPRQSG